MPLNTVYFSLSLILLSLFPLLSNTLFHIPSPGNLHDDILPIPTQPSSSSSTSSPVLPPNFAQLPVVLRSSCTSANPYTVDVAVAYDTTFCQIYDLNRGVATKSVRYLLRSANALFKPACIHFELVHIDPHCSTTTDPYTALRPQPGSSTSNPAHVLIGKLRSFWNVHRKHINRHVAVFLSGFHDGSSTLGVAYGSSACNSHYSYAWVEGPNYLVLAHELGHAIGASHDASGLMRAGFSSDGLVFSAASISQLFRFVSQNPAGRCIQQRPKVQQKVCSPQCHLNNSCFRCTHKLVIAPHLRPCTPMKGFFKCANQSRFRGIYQTTSCPASFGFVKRGYSLDDPSIFCCEQPQQEIRHGIVSNSYPVSRALVNGKYWVYQYVKDRSKMWTVTLIRTKLVPHCGYEKTSNEGGSGDEDGTRSASTSHIPSNSTTPTPSDTTTETLTPSSKPTVSAIASKSSTPTPAISSTATATSTASTTSTQTATPTARASASASSVSTREPTPTETATVTASESVLATPTSTMHTESSAASPSLSAVAVPTYIATSRPSASSTASTSGIPQTVTCRNSLPQRRQFSCTSPTVLRNVLSSTRYPDVYVNILYRQTMSNVTISLQPSSGTRLTRFGMKIGMFRRYNWEKVEVEVVADGNAWKSLQFDEIRPPIGRRHCCNKRLFVFVRADVCGVERCVKWKKRVSVKVRCFKGKGRGCSGDAK